MRNLGLASLLWIAGCNNGGVANTATVDDYQSAAVAAVCQVFARCGLVSASQVNACASSGALLSATGGYSVKDAIAAGRVSYDSAAAQRCVASIASTSCNNLFETTSSDCQTVLHGRVQPGGACQSDVECANGFCQRPGGDLTDGCAGTCTAYVADGADCSASSSRCAPPTYCGSSGTQRLCTQPASQGQPCGSFTLLQCGKGLSCVGDTTTTTGTCQPPPGAGQPCDGQCASGLTCDPASATCKPLEPAGASCTTSSACAGGLLCIGVSTSPGTCEPVVDLGHACGPTAACAADAACDPTSHTCTLRATVGADCSTSGCWLGLYCDGATMKCAQKVPYGGACTPPPMSGGEDPCESGSCSTTTHTCTLVCG